MIVPSIIFALPLLTPESRALAFLAREVPRWSAENKCYSCHNNGDAARALYLARRLRLPVPAKALADTTRWLTRPDRWDHNGGEGPFSDKVLARIHFAAALGEAVAAGESRDRRALERAAELVARDQQESGAWAIEGVGDIGSPITYGTCLVTCTARRTLQQADPKRYREAIARADRWLRAAPVETVLDAAAVLLAVRGADDREAVAQRKRCLGVIRKGEAEKGGWGPYVNSAPEVFDTAVVLLALTGEPSRAELRQAVGRGRAFLIATQQPDGSWVETTRPPGATSYAQRLSTTGWATQALLATRDSSR